jgi:uncharacterized protein
MSGPEPTTRSPAPLDALAVTILCFGWFILGSLAAVGANFPAGQGFTDGGLASTIVTELVLGALALTFLRMRGHAVLALLPRPNVAGGVAGVVLYVVGILTWWMTLAMFDTRNMAAQPIAEIMSNTHVSLTMVLAMSLVNGIYEETFLCFLVDAFRGHGASVAIGVSTLVRLLYHVYQGPLGSVSIVLYGVIMAAFYWRTRWLWPVAFAHVLADLVALT